MSNTQNPTNKKAFHAGRLSHKVQGLFSIFFPLAAYGLATTNPFAVFCLDEQSRSHNFFSRLPLDWL